MKGIIFLFAIWLISIVSFSQQVISGGHVTVKKKGGGEIKQEKLDAATIRCYYKFTQPVTVDKETCQQADTMTLDIGKQVSVYYDAARMRRDSIFGDFMNNKLNVSTIQSFSVMKDGDMSILDNSQGTTMQSNSKGETSLLYKKRSDNEVTIIDRIENSTEKYRYIAKEKPEWEITADTLSVLGYLCQKAVTSFNGREYNAWFSPDIPINDGPWKLYGLPGLVLKATDTENLFSFEIIGLEHLTSPVNIFIGKEDYIKANKKDLAKLKKQQSGGTAVNVNGGNVIMVQKKNKNEYTPLEIE